MASPDGVRLYSRFGFEVMGQVQTAHGTFTSMFRESNRMWDKKSKLGLLIINFKYQPGLNPSEVVTANSWFLKTGTQQSNIRH